jgi:hypothetical protein
MVVMQINGNNSAQGGRLLYKRIATASIGTKFFYKNVNGSAAVRPPTAACSFVSSAVLAQPTFVHDVPEQK